MTNFNGRVRKRERGRPPKHLSKKVDQESRTLADPWEEFRPLYRIWECENCKFDIHRDPEIETLDFVCPRCRGNFARTSKIERAKRDPYTEYGWILFLESRKGKGKKQFLEIQSIILENESDYEDGWIPYSAIKWSIKQRMPISQNQLDRMMKDMVNGHVLEKIKKIDPSVKTPNKNRLFYRFNSLAAARTLTEKGYKKEYSKLIKRSFDLSNQLIHATNVLYRHGLLDEFRDDLRKWNARKKA